MLTESMAGRVVLLEMNYFLSLLPKIPSLIQW